MEFLLWLSLNEPDWYPWGCRFDPWPWCCREPWGRFGLLWLWCRLAAAALIWPLAWKLPYAAGVALKQTNKKVEGARSSFHWVVVTAPFPLSGRHKIQSWLVRPLVHGLKSWVIYQLERFCGWKHEMSQLNSGLSNKYKVSHSKRPGGRHLLGRRFISSATAVGGSGTYSLPSSLLRGLVFILMFAIS